jgi:hypothetical protein
MVDRIDGAQVVIGGDATGALQAIDKVSKGMQALEGVIGPVTAALAGFFTVDYFKHLIEGSMDAIDKMNKLAASTYTTFEGLQVLERQGQRTGASMDAVSEAAKGLEAAIIKFGGGKDDDLNEKFKDLGITFEQIKDLSVDKQFALISDKMKETDMELAEQITTWKALGVEQDKVRGLLAEGSEGFAQARKDLEDFGLAVSNIDAQKVSQAKDALEDIKNVVGGLGTQLAVQLAPQIQGVAELFVDWGRSVGGMAGLVKTNLSDIATIIGIVVDAVSIFGLAFKKAFDDIVAFATPAIDALKSIYNWTVGIIQSIPGVAAASGAVGDAIEGKLTGAADSAKASFKGLMDQIRADFGGQLPSEALDGWLAKVRATSDAAAKSALEANQKQRDAQVQLAEDEEKEEDKKAQREAANAQKSLDRLIKEISDKETNELISYNRREMALAAFHAKGLISDQQFQELEAANTQLHYEKMYQAQAAAFTKSQQLYVGLAGQVSNLLGSITTAIGTEGKKHFAITKAISIAQALVKGYESIVSSYAAGAAIGGPPVGAAFAAIAAATTAVQIAALRSTTADSGGGGATSPASGGDAATAAATQAPQLLTIEGLTPDQLVSGMSVNALVQKISDFTNNGGKVNIRQ